MRQLQTLRLARKRDIGRVCGRPLSPDADVGLRAAIEGLLYATDILCLVLIQEAEVDLWRLDAVELARLIHLGQISNREAVGDCLARQDAVNGKRNAVVRRMDEQALAAADACDAAVPAARRSAPCTACPSRPRSIPITATISPTKAPFALKDLIAPEDAPQAAVSGDG